ncbi:aminotransferase class III-fold pyridoxal phosphate-dependent enzyme [Nocardioides sp. LHG3406-4]|uniref:aminotransferase class III-fold pyridoxal phosphate-dependent enzyme n=1 Tax=Nocardioides sp. LHG3406-4 TaxID=2804575 RepID=UPI003CE76058
MTGPQTGPQTGPVTGPAPQPSATILVEPAPAVDEDWARDALLAEFGIEATVSPLVSERDRNFLARTADGDAFVVKVSNSAEDPDVVTMENDAMQHVATTAPDLPVPRLLARPSDQATAVVVEAPDERRHLMRVVTVLPGASVAHPLPARFAAELGASCARLANALRGFFHPAAGRKIEWDPRRIAMLRPHVSALHPERRQQITRFLDRLDGLPGLTESLPGWPLHADVTLSNVLASPDGTVTGLIDFGDLHHTARVCDLAIALASLLREAEDPWTASAEFLTGYQRHAPLEPAEAKVIGELVLARLVATVLISAWRSDLHTDNVAYVSENDEGSWRMLDRLTGISPEDLSLRFQRMCGTSRVAAAQRSSSGLLERRRSRLGGRLSPLFYREPLHVVRGDGPWLTTADGRRYLDAYNNVPVVGHAHPAVAQAMARQMATLNVHSRYLHENVVELAERIVATMPPGLDTCVFVNSGSEANDLAWRMATEYTGHRGAIVSDWAYHGVTEPTAAMSSNTWPEGHRPDHVATFASPYALAEGTAPGAAEAAARMAVAVEDLGHRGLAMTAIDSMFVSPGVLEPSDDFVAELVAHTRRAGGLFLADEVQAGYGRGGTNLWRFADFGVLPDFVTLGKPMGNGHPIAALVTRREIADRFTQVDEYFSTFGGNPVSCAAALTVLDIIEEGRLPARATEVGAHLRRGVETLADRHPDLVGEVRGHGLIAGIDVRDTEHSRGAAWLAERMRENGVLVSTTGRGDGVLKVRPPLVWDLGHVAVFLEALDRALNRGPEGAAYP